MNILLWRHIECRWDLRLPESRCPIAGFGSFRKTTLPHRGRTCESNTQKCPEIPGPEQHLEELGQLLDQLRSHLISADGNKGTYNDYLRLLEFYRETRDDSARGILVQWVESEESDLVPFGM